MNSQVMNVQLFGASYASVDGAEYASVYVGEPAEADDRGAKGIVIMKMSCTTEVFQSLPSEAEGYPQKIRLEVKLVKASGGRLGQKAVRVLPMDQRPAKQPAVSA